MTGKLLFRTDREETVGDVGVTSACLIGLCNSKGRKSFTCEDLRLGESKRQSVHRLDGDVGWGAAMEIQDNQEIIIINLKK